MLRIATRRASQRFVVRHSSKTASTPAPAPASPPSDSIHSSDIAFKPNNDGWGGGNPQYASNYDRIFGKKNGDAKKAAPEQTAPQPAAQALDARDALALRRILRESGESSALAEILEESGWRRGG
jgi:hypothetical protein